MSPTLSIVFVARHLSYTKALFPTNEQDEAQHQHPQQTVNSGNQRVAGELKLILLYIINMHYNIIYTNVMIIER